MLSQPITRDAGHIYTGRGEFFGKYDGIPVPGVTGMLKVIGANFSQAAYFGARSCAEVVDELMERGALTAMREALGGPGFIKGLTETATKKRDSAAQLGSAVHAMAEHLMTEGRSGQQSTDAAVIQRVEAYADWWKSSGWKKPLTEVMGMNTVVGYGGTLDLLARDEHDVLTLADVKSGASVYREAVLQVTAYGDFTFIQVPDGDGWRLVPMPRIGRYVILHVTTDGVRPIDVEVGEHELMVWHDVCDIYAWQKKVKGRL